MDSKEFLLKLCEAVIDRVTVASQGDEVTLYCDDCEHANELHELLSEHLCEVANRIGWQPKDQ